MTERNIWVDLGDGVCGHCDAAERNYFQPGAADPHEKGNLANCVIELEPVLMR